MAGRHLTRGHYEVVADEASGHALGDVVRIRRNDYRVVGLTRHGALRWAKAGIRVNAVCPGVIETAMTAPLAADERLRSVIESMTPMGRMGKTEEIAEAVVWLCSDAASFLTGHPLVVDGGATAV